MNRKEFMKTDYFEIARKAIEEKADIASIDGVPKSQALSLLIDGALIGIEIGQRISRDVEAKLKR